MSPARRKHSIQMALNRFTYEHLKPVGQISKIRQNTAEAAKTLDSLISEKEPKETSKKEK